MFLKFQRGLKTTHGESPRGKYALERTSWRRLNWVHIIRYNKTEKKRGTDRRNQWNLKRNHQEREQKTNKRREDLKREKEG